MYEFYDFSLTSKAVIPDLAKELPIFTQSHVKQLGKK